ncbi:MAG: hypothetical protein U0174_18230 [Polyangiaceae bacterium]
MTKQLGTSLGRFSRFSPLTVFMSLAAGAGLFVACATEDPGSGGDAGKTDSGQTSKDGSTSNDDGSTPVGDAASDAPAKACTKNEDCPSKVCDINKGTCNAPTCTDGTMNGDEVDLDCGGSACPKCDVQKNCKVSADCTSGVCTNAGAGLKCQPPSCTDGVKNGTETDTDCGGASCGKCDDGKNCAAKGDCVSDVCTGGKCQTPVCNDGVKNNKETGLDCGGPDCPRCADLEGCAVASDCLSGVCADVGAGMQCQPPSCTDGVKNGTESDTDCGGGACPGCSAGLNCATGGDCASLGCNYAGKCAAGRSCTGHYGGDTCGQGGEGGQGAEAWEDCCATAPVVVGGKTVNVDKYQVTAGRMRTFLESVNYDVRGFVQGARAAGQIPQVPGGAAGNTVLSANWDMYLPTSFAGNNDAGELAGCAQKDYSGGACAPGTAFNGIFTAVSRHLGGFIFQQNSQTSTGCFVGSPGTHAFRFPDGQQDGSPPEASQEIYDTKSMNCVDYMVAQAFCVWDGGRLESLPEWQAIYGAAALPWGATPTPKPITTGSYWACRFPWASDLNHPGCGLTWSGTESIEYADYQYSYEYPKLVNVDYITFISAPGRTKGRGPAGHADVIGNNFELTSTLPSYGTTVFNSSHRWSGNGSWEVHGYNKNGGGTTMLLNKYGKLGMRCAHPAP